MNGLPALVDARWPDVEAAKRGVLLVPLGSLEQHGPHLPLDTDAVIAGELAARLHRVRPEAGLAPTLPFGASGEHAAFPGTLSIGTEALGLLLVELVRHASLTWRHVLIVNGHGGNADALRAAATSCAAEGHPLAVASLGAPGTDAHAGWAETSIMLHLAPARVAGHLAAPGNTAPLGELRLRERGVRAASPNGVLGDPTGASAAVGADLVAGMLARLAERYDALG